VRALLQTLAAWRASPIWYLAALLLPVFISTAGLALLALLGQPLPPWPRTEPLRELLPLLVITFVATLLYGGPLGEEAGWRGFALPRLQARHSPLVASLLLSVAWGLWHAPLHLQGVYHGIFPDGLPGILLRIVTTVPTTVLFTWFFKSHQGQPLACRSATHRRQQHRRVLAAGHSGRLRRDGHHDGDADYRGPHVAPAATRGRDGACRGGGRVG
jgi:membrane protease YdiL (CAAX protease family)